VGEKDEIEKDRWNFHLLRILKTSKAQRSLQLRLLSYFRR
jgi:hypothetical protein